MDNLRTNNTGTYIFTDEAFKFIARVSNNDHESKEYKQKIKCYESFVIGLIIGALMNLGYDKVPIVNTQITGTKLVLTVNVPLPVLSWIGKNIIFEDIWDNKKLYLYFQ